jgi:tRNA nucleotidyltransferase/poly(A) polymerase
MYNKALNVLNIFHENGYEAYIVGGYPRDYLLGIKTLDIDICTNAKPKEIMEIFDTEAVSDVGYGSVKVIYKNVKFDVTTYRVDIKYEKNRKPIKIKYVTDLKKDLLRRDFTINTICIDKDGNFIDLLNGREDLDNRVIKTVGNPRHRLKEDSLRILRAIRFASLLEFDIDDRTGYFIKKYGYFLKSLSGSRKREELDKILTSRNKEIGRNLLISFDLCKYLGLNNLSDIVLCDDIIGIWSQLDVSDDYPFSKLEKETIRKVRELLNKELNEINIYRYGLYISTVVGSIKGVSYKIINNIYKNLPITSTKDILLSGEDIKKILNREPGKYISTILSDLEEKIILGELENNRDVLTTYVRNNYKGDK